MKFEIDTERKTIKLMGKLTISQLLEFIEKFTLVEEYVTDYIIIPDVVIQYQTVPAITPNESYKYSFDNAIATYMDTAVKPTHPEYLKSKMEEVS